MHNTRHAILITLACCAATHAQWNAHVAGIPQPQVGGTPFPRSADVAVDPTNGSVWIATDDGGASGTYGPATLTRFTNNTFTPHTLPDPVFGIELDIDDYGTPTYVARAPGNFVTSGVYIEPADVIEQTQQPILQTPAFPVIDYAVDPQGIPALVNFNQSGFNFTRYDVASNDWSTTPHLFTNPELQPSFRSPPAFDFDPQGRPVVAYLSVQNTAVVLRHEPLHGWRPISSNKPANNLYGISLAFYADGSPLFAYGNQQGQIVVTSLDEYLIPTTQIVDQATTRLLPDALAVNPATDSPSIAYTAAPSPFSDLMLATLQPTGWSTTQLPFSAGRANLAFNDEGTPYIGALITRPAGQDFVQSYAVITNDPDLHLPGDFNHDGIYSADDLDHYANNPTDLETYDLDRNGEIDPNDHLVWLRIYNLTSPGDINLDGSVNLLDLSILAANFDQPGSYAQGDLNLDASINLLDLSILASNFTANTIPTPATASLMTLALLALLALHRNQPKQPEPQP
ncbi:hypothetical protein [Mucisphaera calidilacus]|uniref:Dockerin domain-containing protein n=1 Tax=Mucisphaera calidilacus TaxID=2527982 RepID=A0A518C033_9BACT|nr:hypothetical protein [Mucisphaera calidilacus]QDU72581.1 hypothetical protein Pan265_24510 [Mucisphaera calidilacus]